MTRKKVKKTEKINKGLESSVSSSSQSCALYSSINEENPRLGMPMCDPKTTSTPINFNIYPLHNRKKQYLIQEDFGKDDEFIYEMIQDCDSNFKSVGIYSGDLSGIKIYEDFDNLCDEMKMEKENIFENVIFLNSLEIDEKDLSNNYEIVTVKNTEDKSIGRFRPRTLKTGFSS